MNSNQQADNPEIVVENVKRHLRRQGSMRDAATRLGIAPSTLSTFFKKAESNYFSRGTAARLATAYNLNADYLNSGIGSLMEFKEPHNVMSMYDDKGPAPTSIEEHIVSGIRARLRNAFELAQTFNNLLDFTIETAEYITGGGYYDYCQEVIDVLKRSYIKLDARIDPELGFWKKKGDGMVKIERK